MNSKTDVAEHSAATDGYPSGVWFQSAVSGLWYQNHLAAGDVSNVNIDGVLFRGPERSDVCEHGVPDGEWCETCNREYRRAATDPENGNGEQNAPKYWECDRCSGCGWYEGGETIQTHCEACDGHGIVLNEGRKVLTPEQVAEAEMILDVDTVMGSGDG